MELRNRVSNFGRVKVTSVLAAISACVSPSSLKACIVVLRTSQPKSWLGPSSIFCEGRVMPNFSAIAGNSLRLTICMSIGTKTSLAMRRAPDENQEEVSKHHHVPLILSCPAFEPECFHLFLQQPELTSVALFLSDY